MERVKPAYLLSDVMGWEIGRNGHGKALSLCLLLSTSTGTGTLPHAWSTFAIGVLELFLNSESISLAVCL